MVSENNYLIQSSFDQNLSIQTQVSVIEFFPPLVVQEAVQVSRDENQNYREYTISSPASLSPGPYSPELPSSPDYKGGRITPTSKRYVCTTLLLCWGLLLSDWCKDMDYFCTMGLPAGNALTKHCIYIIVHYRISTLWFVFEEVVFDYIVNMLQLTQKLTFCHLVIWYCFKKKKNLMWLVSYIL